MDTKIRRELRILKAYALLSTLLFAVLIFLAAKSPSGKVKFDEIDTERINILGRDGKLRLAISNNERSPGPTIGGLYMKSREGKRGAGFIFFNDDGDECGGLTWTGKKVDGKAAASSGLMFDQYESDQTVGLTYSQRGEERASGLQVWERSLTPIADFARQVNDIELMKDGPEKTEAMKKLREKAVAEGLGGTQRVFVGRTPKNDAAVLLMDTKGKPRIRMAVDSSNAASLQFLDENGKVVFSLPNATPTNK
jgi:hypothetical protein